MNTDDRVKLGDMKKTVAGSAGPRVDIMTGKKIAHDAPQFFKPDTAQELKITRGRKTDAPELEILPDESFQITPGPNAAPIVDFADSIGAGESLFPPTLENLSRSGEFGGSVSPDGELDLADMKRILRKILKSL